MAWYEESFGHEYLKLYAHRDLAKARANIHAILDCLPLSKEEPLLDLCCGAGRHLLVLQEIGFERLVGLDLSDTLLRVAASKLKAANTTSPTPVSLVRADMRYIPHKNHFAAVLSLFTSFGYFSEDAQNQAVLMAVHRALRPGGVFLLDYLNRDHLISNLVPRDEKPFPGGCVQNIRSLTADCRRVEKTITIITQGTQRQFRESVRLYTPAEMAERFRAAGFINIGCYGSLDGGEFTPESERLILVAKKSEINDH